MSTLHAHRAADAMLPGYLPLSPNDGLEQYRMEGTMAVRSMLRELMAARAHVALHSNEDEHIHLLTRIDALETDNVCLMIDADPSLYDPLLNTHGLTLVGSTGSVKIQLNFDSLALRQDEHGQHLVARIPNHGWRVQRRNDFRVMPPAVDMTQVFFRKTGGGEAWGELHDLSAGGLCFYWPTDLPLPNAGELLRHSRIERARANALPCDLKVIRIAAAADRQGRHLISCRFELLPESVSRQIQIYVMDVERRIRAARTI
ncbi:MAG: flagellar brake protein [Lautropia sp.]|nr:flagellar brake protein [Lautropia sp.]